MNEQVSDKASANNPELSEKTSAPRRSTRVLHSVPLDISGMNKLGNHVYESTSAVAVSCHGCLYPSRYGYSSGAWVTVEVAGQQQGGKPHPVRAQVKFVRLPRTPRELYQVGVEFESPANIWGIPSPPADWLQFSGETIPASGLPELPNFGAPEKSSSAASLAASRAPGAGEYTGGKIAGNASAAFRSAAPANTSLTATGLAPAAKTNGTSPIESVFASENLLHALEGMLQQAAEKAVASAISSTLTPAVNQAAKAVMNFSQSCVRKVEEHCAQTREKFVASLQQDFLARTQADMKRAQQQLQEQLRVQMETVVVKAREAALLLEKNAAEVPSRLAEARGALQQATGQLQGELSTQMRETAGRAVSELREETIRLAGQHAGTLHQRMDETAKAAQARLDAAADASLAELQAATKAETERLAAAARQSAESSMAAIAAEWDARQRVTQEQNAQSLQTEMEQFRQRLETILNTSMATAVAAANEHSRILMDSLLKGTSEQLKNSIG